jgi:GTPase
VGTGIDARPRNHTNLLNQPEDNMNLVATPVRSQLRITLTGPTTSGKSSLLGTLSTATLDNGRGKSRLSLLKHRHEIVSGVTSSVAQELIGYKDDRVINYASGNVTSWTDIHSSAENGRLVFVSDSAGHPRYRRTTVRGLVGWAPHVRSPEIMPP